MTGACVRCGGGLPVRADPRGRPARYCSDACRAAASRERVDAGHRAALSAAEQRAYERGRRSGYAEGWAAALRASVRRTAARTEPAAAPGGQFLPGMDTPAATAGTGGLSRQQRRAAERAARKRGGVR